MVVVSAQAVKRFTTVLVEHVDGLNLGQGLQGAVHGCETDLLPALRERSMDISCGPEVLRIAHDLHHGSALPSAALADALAYLFSARGVLMARIDPCFSACVGVCARVSCCVVLMSSNHDTDTTRNRFKKMRYSVGDIFNWLSRNKVSSWCPLGHSARSVRLGPGSFSLFSSRSIRACPIWIQ